MLDENGSRRPRVGIAFHRFGPYHWARIRGAARYLDVVAVETSLETSEYAWERFSGDRSIEHLVLSEGDIREASPWAIRSRVFRNLDGLALDAIAVPGYGSSDATAILSWALARRVPAVLMSESTSWDTDRRWPLEVYKSWLVRSFGAALVGGTAHLQYLIALGFESDRIRLGYDVVDNQFFSRMAYELRDPDLRSEDRFFLASGRFIEKKNFPRLVDAYAAYRSRVSEPWRLVLLGDGPLRGAIEARIRYHRIEEFVDLPGFLQYSELATHYGRASCFIHPSTVEQWGLVVNEAMASGLPVIVSDRCGCAMDLVREGVNGFVFDPLDVDNLADRCCAVSSASEVDLAAMSRASKNIVSDFSPDRFGRGLRDAVALSRRNGTRSFRASLMGASSLAMAALQRIR